MTSTRRGTPLCDARLAGGGWHRLGGAPWIMESPAGALFAFCSRGCLISFVAESCLTDRFDGLEQLPSVRVLRLARSMAPTDDALVYDGDHTTEA